MNNRTKTIVINTTTLSVLFCVFYLLFTINPLVGALKIGERIAGDYYETACNYKENKEYSKAVFFYNLALRVNPNDFRSYYNRGGAYLEIGLYDEVIKDSRKAIELNVIQKNDYDKTKLFYKVWTYNNLALAYQRKGNYPGALRNYSIAIDTNSNETLYANRARTYEKMGLHQKALDDISMSIKWGREDPDTYYTRGLIHGNMYNFELSLTDYNKSLELKPHDTWALNNRGNIHVDMGNYDLALKDFNKVISIGEFPAVYASRGTMWEKKGEFEKALNDYYTSLTMHPNYDYPMSKIAWILSTCPEKKYLNGKRALELAIKAVNIDNNDYRNYRILAASQAITGNFEEAVKSIDEAIAKLDKYQKKYLLDELENQKKNHTNKLPWIENVK